jgi:hypothetical protein
MATCEVETRQVLGDASVTVRTCQAPAFVLIADATGAQQGCVCEAHAVEFEQLGGWVRQGAC